MENAGFGVLHLDMVSTVSIVYSLPDDVLTLNIDFIRIVIFDFLTFLTIFDLRLARFFQEPTIV